MSIHHEKLQKHNANAIILQRPADLWFFVVVVMKMYAYTDASCAKENTYPSWKSFQLIGYS